MFDIIDGTIGRIPGLGTLLDIFGVYLAYQMCGPLGIAYAWEIIDLTDQLDGFVPTLTLLYLISPKEG